MRGIIVLCLCTLALAVHQTYSYSPQPSKGYSVVSSASSSGGYSQNSYIGSKQHIHQQQQQQQQPQAIVSKRFFIHSAPEEEEDQYQEKLVTVGVPKKNYNVVFIKSPSKGARKTAIKIHPSHSEDKTVIYVLNKNNEPDDVQTEVIEYPTTTSRPEVFHIKYKTNEEAAHVQQQIQSQYDSLGGSSQVSDEGVAPVTSVIGSLGSSGGSAGISAHHSVHSSG